jgi:anti-sigma-K factor RskA
MLRLRAFARFWYEFIVGDDWRVAVAVLAALAVTALVAAAGLPRMVGASPRPFSWCCH